MADLNGAGSGTFGGLTGVGVGQTQWWDVTIDRPVSGNPSPTATPVVETTLESWDTGVASVQVQVSTSPAFGTTVHDSTVTQSDGVAAGRLVTGLSDQTWYYVRARAGDGTNWGLWSATSSFFVDLDSGRGFRYSTLNVGVEITPEDNWAAYVYSNIGIEIILEDNWAAYVYSNIGVEITLEDNWAAYVYVGDVNTLTPTPTIWFLLPNYGRDGDGISIYGFGFGDLQATYSGTVQIDWGGVIGWQTIGVVTWQTFPPTADAYTEDRVLDSSIPMIDMQHQVVEIIVPPGAIPPGYPLRICTDGP